VQSNRAKLPVVLMSGLPHDQIGDGIQRLPQHELPPLLLKPVDTRQLFQVIELKLAGNQALSPKDRQHLMALAAQAMRQILVDHVRQRRTEKHGGQWQRLTLTESVPSGDAAHVEVACLDELLQSLQQFDPRAARMVELRYFGGYDENEIAGLLEVSVRTVRRDWRRTRAWLKTELES